MKKKIFAIYALAGALVASPIFTSCVEDAESTSVTALRGAKAEQLKAAAALANAQAQAETILANAEAQFKAAQAAYYNGMAEAENAEAEYQKELTKQAQEKFALEIAKLEAEAELALLKAQKEIEEVKNSLSDVEYNRFNALYNRYSNELSKLTNWKNNLFNMKANLALMEANVLSEEAWNNRNTISIKQSIEVAKAQLAVYKENLNLDNATLSAKAEAAFVEYQMASKKFKASEEPSKLVAANELVIDKNEEMDELRSIISEINRIYDIVNYSWGSMDVRINTDNGFSNNDRYYYYNYYHNIRIDETDKLSATRNYESNVNHYAELLGKADDTKDKNTAYGRLAAANADMTTAKAMPETTDAEKAAKKQAIQNAEYAIAQATDDLADKQRWYNEAVEQQTKFNEALAALDVTAANKLAEEMVAANEANELAWEAWEKAYEAIDEVWEEYRALSNLAWQAGDNINEEIAILEANIAELEANLVLYERNTAEENLAMAKEQIAQLEAKIAIQEKVVAECKAALDALLGEEAEEETPAE